MEIAGAETQRRRLEAVGEDLTSLFRRPEISSRLRLNPGPDDWSAMQILGHVVEMIPYWMQHCEMLIAADGSPPRFGRSADSPERLAGVEAGNTGNADDLLAQLHDEIITAGRRISDLTPAELAKTGIHVRMGVMTVGDIVDRFIVTHAEEHLGQIRAAISSQGEGKGTSR